MNDTYDRNFNAAALALETGFTSKSAKKDAMGCLSRCYEKCTVANREITRNEAIAIWGDARYEWCADQVALFDKHELPNELHNYRPAKHTVAARDFAQQIETLQAMREEIKLSEISAKAFSEQAIVRKAEKQATEDIVDNGFRTSFWISTQQVWCRMYTGTTYMRVIWYKKGRVVAFQSVMADVSEQVIAWTTGGQPDMSTWMSGDIQKWYEDRGVKAA